MEQRKDDMTPLVPEKSTDGKLARSHPNRAQRRAAEAQQKQIDKKRKKRRGTLGFLCQHHRTGAFDYIVAASEKRAKSIIADRHNTLPALINARRVKELDGELAQVYDVSSPFIQPFVRYITIDPSWRNDAYWQSGFYHTTLSTFERNVLDESDTLANTEKRLDELWDQHRTADDGVAGKIFWYMRKALKQLDLRDLPKLDWVRVDFFPCVDKEETPNDHDHAISVGWEFAYETFEIVVDPDDKMTVIVDGHLDDLPPKESNSFDDAKIWLKQYRKDEGDE